MVGKGGQMEFRARAAGFACWNCFAPALAVEAEAVPARRCPGFQAAKAGGFLAGRAVVEPVDKKMGRMPQLRLLLRLWRTPGNTLPKAQMPGGRARLQEAESCLR